MKKYDYTYGMERPVYTIYTLVDPKYKDIPRYIGFTEGDIPEHGYSVGVKDTAHVTRRNRLNIQHVRTGINKPNTIPRNL